MTKFKDTETESWIEGGSLVDIGDSRLRVSKQLRPYRYSRLDGS